MLHFVFHKMVPKLKEVQEDVDKVEEDLEEDLVMTLSVMEQKVVQMILFSFFSQTSQKMVFCYQNCSDLLWEKIVSSDREFFLKFEAKCQEFAKLLR